MPLPFILGGLAIAAVGTGVVKGAGGYIDKSDADDILKEVKRIHDTANKNIETAQNDCTRSLGELGKLYLEIGQDFNEFQTLAKQLINQIENSNNSHLKVNIPKLSLAKIESISLNSAAFLGKMVGGAAGGAAAAYAVYGGVMSLAAASTGTAISSLSGVAAYNATLAAIGGGSIASGGFGMAVGAQILGGVVAAPVALVAGLAYASYGAEALQKAKQSKKEVDDYLLKSVSIQSRLASTKSYIDSLKFEVSSLHAHFQTYLEDLKIVEMMVRRNKQSKLENQPEILRMIKNGYAMAAILADIITTPLFKIKTDDDGNPILNKDNAPTLSQDKLGLNIPNQDEMERQIDNAQHKLNNLDE